MKGLGWPIFPQKAGHCWQKNAELDDFTVQLNRVIILSMVPPLMEQVDKAKKQGSQLLALSQDTLWTIQ